MPALYMLDCMASFNQKQETARRAENPEGKLVLLLIYIYCLSISIVYLHLMFIFMYCLSTSTAYRSTSTGISDLYKRQNNITGTMKSTFQGHPR